MTRNVVVTFQGKPFLFNLPVQYSGINTHTMGCGGEAGEQESFAEEDAPTRPHFIIPLTQRYLQTVLMFETQR